MINSKEPISFLKPSSIQRINTNLKHLRNLSFYNQIQEQEDELRFQKDEIRKQEQEIESQRSTIKQMQEQINEIDTQLLTTP